MRAYKDIVEKLGVIAIAFSLYLLTFRINQTLDKYVLYAQGVALVFLPAGVKHVSILVGRYWGALGCFLALAYVTPEFWPDISWVDMFRYSGISTLATLLALLFGMNLLGIHNDLSNLRFVHLPWLDLITTTTHSFVTNAYFIAEGMKLNEEYLSNAMAMAVGDFTGSFAMMLLLWGTIQLKRKLKPQI